MKIAYFLSVLVLGFHSVFAMACGGESPRVVRIESTHSDTQFNISVEMLGNQYMFKDDDGVALAAFLIQALRGIHLKQMSDGASYSDLMDSSLPQGPTILPKFQKILIHLSLAMKKYEVEVHGNPDPRALAYEAKFLEVHRLADQFARDLQNGQSLTWSLVDRIGEQLDDVTGMVSDDVEFRGKIQSVPLNSKENPITTVLMSNRLMTGIPRGGCQGFDKESLEQY